MDDFKILFDKIKHRDKASFQILTETYGWKLYSYIRKNVDNRELADTIFSETLSRFHHNAEKFDCQDPIEAMLCLYADEIQKTHSSVPAAVPAQNQKVFPEPPYDAAPAPKKKKKCSVLAGIFYTICILLLLAAIAVALWFLVGMLVDMEILPKAWDFGYSWFNANIADLF